MRSSVIGLLGARERFYKELYSIAKKNAHLWATMTPEEFAKIVVYQTDHKVDIKQLTLLLEAADNTSRLRSNPLEPIDFTEILL